jgi:hypothetical protein
MSSIVYRKYFGKRFWRNKGGYWVNGMPIHAQRWVWINHFGTIPEGMDIHHRDGDKENNDISNLEMLSRSEHLKRHWQEGRFDLNQRRIQLAEARKWLKTPEGRIKQSQSSKEAWKNRKTTELRCHECDHPFNSTQPWAKFCSGLCGTKTWRRNARKVVE